MTQGLYNVCLCDDVGTALQILRYLYFMLDFLLHYWLEDFNNAFSIICGMEDVTYFTDLPRLNVPARWLSS